MRTEDHLQAFEERKATMLKWGIEVRGFEKSQRTVGDNATRAIAELLSAYLHKAKKISEGAQMNHRWFKSSDAENKLPEFEHKKVILARLMELENLCEKLSYGAPAPRKEIEHAADIFAELEQMLKEMMK